ncbi:putative defense protein Hdd11-like [Branchiostoma floridae x Branchiostoma japonicum]
MLSLVLLSLVAGSLAHHNGAPHQACRDGIPNHHPVAATGGTAPFSLSGGAYTPGAPIQLTISGSGPFRGFMIKASEGSFSATGSNIVMDCDGTADSISHSEASDKNSVTVTYNPPASAAGPISMRLSVVVNHDLYWNPTTYTLSQNAAVITG